MQGKVRERERGNEGGGERVRYCGFSSHIYGKKMKKVRIHKDLEVFQLSFKLACEIHELSKSFPNEERYSLTDQIRRSSRSVSANIAEAFRKRRYEKAFISKLSDVEAEAAETQVLLDFSKKFEYIDNQDYHRLFSSYNDLLGKIVTMIVNSGKWTL